MHGCVPEYLYMYHMHAGAHGGQKKLDTLQLNLQL